MIGKVLLAVAAMSITSAADAAYTWETPFTCGDNIGGCYPIYETPAVIRDVLLGWGLNVGSLASVAIRVDQATDYADYRIVGISDDEFAYGSVTASGTESMSVHFGNLAAPLTISGTASSGSVGPRGTVVPFSFGGQSTSAATSTNLDQYLNLGTLTFSGSNPVFNVTWTNATGYVDTSAGPYRQMIGSLVYTFAEGGVPEPGTWGTMLLGFGAIGLVARRRRRMADGRVIA